MRKDAMNNTQKKLLVTSAINNYKCAAVDTVNGLQNALIAFGYLKGMLAALELTMTVDKPDLVVIDYPDGKEFCRWERVVK